jgi:hypothetical protein
MAFTLLSAGSTLLLVVQRYSRPCPLTEKPEGLLAYACLLYGSDGKVQDILRDSVMAAGVDGKASELARERWTVDIAAHFHLGPVAETGVVRGLRVSGLERVPSKTGSTAVSNGTV